jgi:hypothetical protein
MKYAAFLLALLLTPLVAVAQIAPETRWADPSYVELDVEFPGDGYHANWELFRCACGDLLVHSELDMPGDAEVGETLMVSRRAVLSRGFGDNQEEFGSSMDAPALMMQLALRLLERVQPAGPSAVNDAVIVEATEEIMNIMLDTGTAVGGFQAPWSVQGGLSAQGETKRRFDLNFEFTIRDDDGEQDVGMRLKGVADFAKTPFPIPGTAPLANWTLTWRDPDDPAAKQMEGIETLEALRTLIKEL